MKLIDLTNQKFGTVTAVERIGGRRNIWRCVCKCGKNRMVQSYNLRSGHTTSCGSCARMGNQWGRKYSVDHSFFDVIDHPDKAYFLGLLYADGCNYEPKGQIILALKENDRDIIEKFKEMIKFSGPIARAKLRGFKKNSHAKGWAARITISSHRISHALTMHGCMARKSLILNFPSFINDPLMPHFIRGYFDGDGFIMKWRGVGSSHAGFCGTMKFCEGLRDYILEKHNIRSKIRPNNSIFTLLVNRIDDLKRLHSMLYQNSDVFLPRKKEVFDVVAARKTRIPNGSEVQRAAWRADYRRLNKWRSRRNSTVNTEMLAQA